MTLELIDTRFGRVGYPKIVEYTESDLPDRWENAWKHRSAYGTNYYIEQTSKQFTYALNYQGYREQEWSTIDWKNSYIFLGCSHTFGVGVSNEETIPKIMQRSLGNYCINLGIPGGCNAFSMFNSSKLINYGIRPKGIFFQRTYNNRWFDIKKDEVLSFNATEKNYRKYFKNAEYVDFLDKNIKDVIISQWKNTCPVIEFTLETVTSGCYATKYIARDGCHYNGEYFKKVAYALCDKYNSIKETI